MPPTFADWPDDPPFLDVPGMRLRAMRDEDAADWYAYLRREEVTRHTSWRLEGVGTLAGLIRAYAQPGQSHSMRFAIVGQDDRLVGTIGLNEIALPQRRAEIAYDIAPAHWRRGLATKACAAMTAWALETLGFARIQATVLDSNAASAGVLARCGFHREGLLHAYRIVRGEPRHFWMYARTWQRGERHGS
ncbi:MAG: GNAT family N-acetyltransferase [Achromobacter sp.]|uniref:GNAT family N-acetyltransferase n=1 Tax=Achromobacter sp. TaxID=134375 RepID=UPI003D058264